MTSTYTALKSVTCRIDQSPKQNNSPCKTMKCKKTYHTVNSAMFEASVITINETEKRNKINSNSFYKNTWCQTQQPRPVPNWRVPPPGEFNAESFTKLAATVFPYCCNSNKKTKKKIKFKKLMPCGASHHRARH